MKTSDGKRDEQQSINLLISNRRENFTYKTSTKVFLTKYLTSFKNRFKFNIYTERIKLTFIHESWDNHMRKVKSEMNGEASANIP